MKNFLSKYIKKHPIFCIVLGTVLFVILFQAIQLTTNTKIVITFKDLRPFHCRAPVYFKGFKIGHVINVAPSKDYQTTLVTVLIHPKMKLPSNTSAKIKVHKTRWMHRDYIDLIYPETPSNACLKNNSVIEGKSSIDFNSYLASVSQDTYEEMEKNASAILKNLNESTEMLYSVLNIVNNILYDSQNNIKNTIGNVEQTTKSSSQIIGKIDNAISQQQLKDTISNVQSVTENANTTLNNLTSTTNNLNQATPNLDTTVDNVNSIIENVDEITCGIKQTLKKNFGVLRLLFGRPIPPCCSCK